MWSKALCGILHHELSNYCRGPWQPLLSGEPGTSTWDLRAGNDGESWVRGQGEVKQQVGEGDSPISLQRTSLWVSATLSFGCVGTNSVLQHMPSFFKLLEAYSGLSTAFYLFESMWSIWSCGQVCKCLQLTLVNGMDWWQSLTCRTCLNVHVFDVVTAFRLVQLLKWLYNVFEVVKLLMIWSKWILLTYGFNENIQSLYSQINVL